MIPTTQLSWLLILLNIKQVITMVLLQSDMLCATFNNDARFIAGAGVSGIVQLWDVNSRRIRRTFDKPVSKYTLLS